MSEGRGAGAWLRRAGRIDLAGGEAALWSVAEGRLGRRWRSVRLDAAGTLLSDLLLDLDPAGRWTRLELATARGILTLHPDPDGCAVHGNAVTERGVVPLAFPWSPGHRLVVEGEPVAAVALGGPSGDASSAPGLRVSADLSVTAGEALVVPAGSPNGLPGPSWPLEP
jgi:hypothetical protein